MKDRVSLANRAKRLLDDVRWALARRLEPELMRELEVYVKIYYAEESCTLLVGNITVYHVHNILETIEMIYGTVQQSVNNVIQELPHQELRKIKGYDVILKDLRSQEETSWEQGWYGKLRFSRKD